MSLKDNEKQQRDDVLWVMSTLQGRRFMWRLLGQCGVHRAMEGDADQRAIQEGARRIGLFLEGITTDASEDLFFTMMLEAKNRVVEENYEHTKHNDPDTESSNTTSSAGESEYDHTTGGYDSGESLPEWESGLNARFL